MKQNTFNALTATFVGSVLQTIPASISSKNMQHWIEKPKQLQNILHEILMSDFIPIESDDVSPNSKLRFNVIKNGDEGFDRHTAKFIAVVVENIPPIENERMEFWNKHLNTLQREMTKVLL